MPDIEQTDKTDTLEALIRSTINLYARFGVERPGLPVMQPIFEEEVQELIEAAQVGEDKAHIAEEAADVIVTAIGMCLARDVSLAQILEQARAVVAKNDAKTYETHAVNGAGKIARKP
jgi:NTP pyrophosphatase (non-canonical NTP hydrolase)